MRLIGRCMAVATAVLACGTPASYRPVTLASDLGTLLVAHPAPGGTSKLPPPRWLRVGAGRGCAAFDSENRLTWQCWDVHGAPRPWMQGLHAWPVPWLDDMSVTVLSDRLCTKAKGFKAPTRCWRPPGPGQEQGSELAVLEARRSPDDPPDLGWGVPSSPNDAACISREGKVACHGPGYSPADEPDRSVVVEFTAPTIAEAAVVSSVCSAESSDSQCLVRRGCSRSPISLPRCGSSSSRGTSWSELLPDAASLSGQSVRINGALAVQTLWGCGALGCSEGDCCNTTGGSIGVAGAGHLLALQGLSCGGDDSEACCDAPAYGQTVTVTGRLVPATDSSWGVDWMLEDPQICAW